MVTCPSFSTVQHHLQQIEYTPALITGLVASVALGIFLIIAANRFSAISQIAGSIGMAIGSIYFAIGLLGLLGYTLSTKPNH